MVASKISTQTIARALAPEDIRRRDHVAVLHETWQILPCFIDPTLRDVTPISIALLPYPTVAPYRVIDVCLPFVLVKDVYGGHTTLDLRRVRLARVGDGYAKRVWRKIRAGDKGRRKRKRKRKSAKRRR